MRYFILLAFCLGCGSTQSPTLVPPAETGSAETGSAETGSAETGSAETGSAENGAPVTSCTDFRFELGAYVETESSEPSEESPGGFSSGFQPLSLRFECDSAAQQVALGDLRSSCRAGFRRRWRQSCGSEITVRNGQVEVDDPDNVLTEEAFQQVTSMAPAGTLFTWWIASNVRRALIRGETFDVIGTPTGFTVVRRDDSELLYSHP